MDTMMTERLLIRYFTREDSEDLFDYMSREEMVRYEPFGPFSRTDAIKEATRRATDEKYMAVCLKNEKGRNEKMIGELYLGMREPAELSTWEIRFVFHPHYQSEGYEREACKALLDYAFAERKVRRLVAKCSPENRPFWLILERLGFRREGRFRENIYYKRGAGDEPIWVDTMEYGLLKNEYNNTLG